MADDAEYPVYGANGKIGRFHLYNHQDPQLLITCRGATCGSVNFSEPFSWITGNAMVVRPKTSRLHMGYLMYFFRGALDFSTVITGAAQPQITRQSLAPVRLPLPPLEEQKRIVAVLDQAFAALDRARANAEASLADAEALFRQARVKALAPESVPLIWRSETVGSIVDVQSGFAFRSADYSKAGHFLIRIANVQDGQLSLHKPMYVQLDPKTLRFELNQGDVLTSLTGNIGRVAEVKAEHLPAALNQRVARLKIKNRKDIHRDFLMLFLQSELFGNPLREKSHGAAQLNVSPKEIANVAIWLPPLAEQRKIAERLVIMWDRVQELRVRYQAEVDDIADLRQSLLQQAFAGRLTI